MAEKLSAVELAAIRDWDALFGIDDLAEQHVVALIGHIDAMQAEFNDLVRASDDLIDEKDARIRVLEKAFGRVSEMISERYGENDDDEFSDELNACFEVLHPKNEQSG